MNCPPCLRRLLIPALALLCLFGGVSCSTTEYYFGSARAAGGGFYVNQVRPTMQRARWGFSRVRDRITDPFFGDRYDDSFWNGDQMSGSPSMRISLSEQRVYFFKGGKLAGMSPISSGREGYGTTPGKFRITEKDIDHKSSWYGDYVDEYGDVVMREIDVRKDKRPPGAKFDGANMRYFMRVNGPIGMHEGYLPGYPASHGCIRLPSHMAEAFYHATPLGTPVEIVR
jgi:hypothetical protein